MRYLIDLTMNQQLLLALVSTISFVNDLDKRINVELQFSALTQIALAIKHLKYNDQQDKALQNPYLLFAGQVHRARLRGQEVVVKVQRPGLKDLFDIDLKNLRVCYFTF